MTGRRNVTLALDERVARWARVEAAKRDISVSKFVAQTLAREMRNQSRYESAMRDFLTAPRSSMGWRGAFGPREDSHDRSRLR